jgi:hypothetical protein
VLRFEISGEVLASMREALARIRRDAGEPLDDDAALLLMARAVLEGPPSTERQSTERPHYRAQYRQSRRPSDVWCSGVITGAAWFRGAGRRSMSTSTIWRCVPRVVSMIRTTSSPFVERITELSIAARSSSKAKSLPA